MHIDAAHAGGHALAGYRLLVIEQAGTAIAAALAAEGGEIVGPTADAGEALALAVCEPIDVAIVGAPVDGLAPLAALLEAEMVPIVSADAIAPPALAPSVRAAAEGQIRPASGLDGSA